MADLGTNVRYIKGIGEARAAALEKLGITTLGDLIAYFPRGYEDRTQVRPIRELTAGESVCVRGMVAADLTAYRISGGRTIAKTRVVDDSGSLDLVFFNMEHRRDALHQGDVCVFFGKVEDNLRRKQMINPLFEPEGWQQVTGRIMPIYPLTAGVTQGLMARAARQGLDACRELLPDVLPDEVRQAHKLCYVNYAYENIHFPSSPEALEVARRRLVFEELFLLTCGLQLLRQRRRDVAGPACHPMDMGPFYRRLPFALTGAQRRAIADAVEDMVSGKPMNRLCQGDVGSGKTMVAAACIWFAVENGWQTALMAPTEILARQHYLTALRRFARYPVNIDVVSRFRTPAQMKETLRRVEEGRVDILIGTHRLFNKDVRFKDLGLLVVDEEQRFGVQHKEKLKERFAQVDVLSLSATPIPRTLNMALSGIRDMSTIEEPPHDRQPVQTYVVEHEWPVIAEAIRRELSRGGQVYYLHNRVENIESTAGRLRQWLGEDVAIGIAHGKMAERELSSVMQQMADGEIQVLVCTTIIETGIDIPNVNTLIIEDADRLGPAAPDPGPHRPQRPPGLCVSDLPPREGADGGGLQAAVRHPGVRHLRLRLPHRHAGPGDPGGGQPAGAGAVRLSHERGL